MHRSKWIIVALLLVCTLPAAGQTRPSDLKFPPLTFQPPDPAKYRVELAGGLRAYLAEDHTLPLITLTAFVQYGSLYDPAEKAGLARLMQNAYIKGGTAAREGSAIEERLDFLGANLSLNVGERFTTLTMNLLSKDLDEGLAIFTDVLRNPAFRPDSLPLVKGRIIEQLRQANDSPRQLLEREYEKLLYGDCAITRQPFKKTIDALTSDDLKTTHGQYFFPGNMILTAAGDFDKAGLQGKIEAAIHGWVNTDVKLPVIPRQFPPVAPGVYFVQKEINQGYIDIGHLGLDDTNPDYYAVQVMNFILGGGSFTSRITTKVRSDEGLAYNTGSRFTYRPRLPGMFAGYVQTKSSTVGYAISLILKEFERIRTEPVTDAEMNTAKNFYLESFADFFTTPAVIVRNFANLELEGKPMHYYRKYRDNIAKVTKEDVLRVAQTYIHPDRMAVLVVGNFEKCNVVSDKYNQTLDSFGPIRKVSIMDYITGEPFK